MRLAMIITVFVIFASSVSAHANGCHVLTLYAYINDYQISSVKCSKGKLYNEGTNSFYVQQSGGHGPSCDVAFVQHGFEVSRINIQQNLCLLKAGDIHVSHLSGKVPILTINKGSFSYSERGIIKITGFK